jgi:hypothetical protein
MVGFPKVCQVHMAILKLQIQETKTISHNKTWSYNRLKLIIFKKSWKNLVGFLRSFQACMIVLNSKSNIQKNPNVNKNFTTIEAHHLQAVCSLMCFSQSDHQLLTYFEQQKIWLALLTTQKNLFFFFSNILSCASQCPPRPAWHYHCPPTLLLPKEKLWFQCPRTCFMALP